MSKGVYYTANTLRSKAYARLNGTAIKLLNEFMLRRVLMEKKVREKSRIPYDSAKHIINNGEIILRYKDIKRLCNITSQDTATRAIDLLVEVGFINITEQGGSGRPSKYALSDRWMKYGKDNFQEEKRKKLINQRIGKKTRFKPKNKIHPKKSNQL